MYKKATNFYNEKRQFKRLNINIPIKYKLLHEDSIYDTIMHDISEGGMRLMSKIFIPPSKEILFELNLLNQGNPIVSNGKIAWIKSHRFENSFYEAGIKFSGLEDLHRKHLYNFIKRHTTK